MADLNGIYNRRRKRVIFFCTFSYGAVDLSAGRNVLRVGPSDALHDTPHLVHARLHFLRYSSVDGLLSLGSWAGITQRVSALPIVTGFIVSRALLI